MSHLRIGLAGAVMLAVTACGIGPWASSPTDLAGSWRLASGTLNGEPLPVVAGSEPTLMVEEARMQGSTGCNHYGADFLLEGDNLQIRPVEVTEMACEEPLMRSEAAFLASLSLIERASRVGDRLTMSGENVELHFSLVPPVAAAELIGTRWILDTLISGETASSVGGEPATLELHVDGTLEGSTGCRTFSGTYVIDGAEVHATQLSTDDRACPPGLAAQDDHVLAVIGDGFRAEIDGERLTLRSSGDDRSLGYRTG